MNRWRLGLPRITRGGLLSSAAILIVTLLAVSMGGLTLLRLSRSHAEVSALSNRNVARLNIMGEIRGQQARINDGVANMFAPDADAAKKAASVAKIARAASNMDSLMYQYRELVRGTAAQDAFEVLLRTWQGFYNGLHVYILREQPIPGLPLIAGPQQLGAMTVSITDGLDAQANLERAEAAAVARHERDAYRATLLQLAIGLSTGLLLATAIGVVAVRSETARRRAARRFGALVQASVDVIAVVGADGRHTYLSPSTETIMGYAPEELLGEPFHKVLHPDDIARAEELHGAFTARVGQEEHRFETRVLHADGGWRWHEVVARNLLDDPAVRGVVVNHRDITERRQFQDRLAYEATHDALTGLANRVAFLGELEDALGRDRAHGERVAVMFLDLNGFKQVNDTWGHEAGDDLLKGFAQVLQDSVLGADTVARLGGDEFGVVLGNIGTASNAEAVARRIVGGIAEPIVAAGRPVHARTSIGIALSEADCDAPDELLRRADLAMYHVKRQGLNGWRCYQEGMDVGPDAAAPGLQEAVPGSTALD
ncbi:MAG TPA: sensor domain-containing diguanylate cyclase [Rugosimonospora sp.]|nr:sensor domain-containing diguanylate cyclase [Rugosimonospora sp.]